MTTFNSIDVETANADRASICQIGIAHVRDGVVVDRWQSLVNPEAWFDRWNVSIHGIGKEDVRKSPTLPEVIEELHRRLRDSVLISHSSFDRVAFERATSRYDLEPLSVKWLDSSMIVRRAWPERYGRRGYGLKNVAKDLDISFRHHDALEDAGAAAEIVLRACASTQTDIEDWLQRVTQPIFASTAKATRRRDANTSTTKAARRRDANISTTRAGLRPEANVEGALFGETLVFTGRLGMSRREAAEIAATAGCNVAANVTQKTTLLVIGTQRKGGLSGYDKSTKHRNAESLIQKGADIQILSETDFLELMGVI